MNIVVRILSEFYVLTKNRIKIQSYKGKNKDNKRKQNN